MGYKTVLIASTGLIGSQFLECLKEEDGIDVNAITRRSITGLDHKVFIKQSIYDFKNNEKIRSKLYTDILICTFGTTIKNAGSQDEFVRVDHDIPFNLSKIAQEEGCKTMILISSVGADSNSKYFNTRMKGKLEDDIREIGFETYHIIRTSLLLCDRNEFRPGEYLFKLNMGSLAFMIPWQYKHI